MSRKVEWVVRVVATHDEIVTETSPLCTLIECLRYAGLIQIHRNGDTGICFDLRCRATGDTDTWAERNADRMRGFGWNAIKAPAWTGTEKRPS